MNPKPKNMTMKYDSDRKTKMIKSSVSKNKRKGSLSVLVNNENNSAINNLLNKNYMSRLEAEAVKCQKIKTFHPIQLISTKYSNIQTTNICKTIEIMSTKKNSVAKYQNQFQRSSSPKVHSQYMFKPDTYLSYTDKIMNMSRGCSPRNASTSIDRAKAFKKFFTKNKYLKDKERKLFLRKNIFEKYSTINLRVKKKSESGKQIDTTNAINSNTNNISDNKKKKGGDRPTIKNSNLVNKAVCGNRSQKNQSASPKIDFNKTNNQTKADYSNFNNNQKNEAKHRPVTTNSITDKAIGESNGTCSNSKDVETQISARIISYEIPVLVKQKEEAMSNIIDFKGPLDSDMAPNENSQNLIYVKKPLVPNTASNVEYKIIINGIQGHNDMLDQNHKYLSGGVMNKDTRSVDDVKILKLANDQINLMENSSNCHSDSSSFEERRNLKRSSVKKKRHCEQQHPKPADMILQPRLKTSGSHDCTICRSFSMHRPERLKTEMFSKIEKSVFEEFNKKKSISNNLFAYYLEHSNRANHSRNNYTIDSDHTTITDKNNPKKKFNTYRLPTQLYNNNKKTKAIPYIPKYTTNFYGNFHNNLNMSILTELNPSQIKPDTVIRPKKATKKKLNTKGLKKRNKSQKDDPKTRKFICDTPANGDNNSIQIEALPAESVQNVSDNLIKKFFDSEDEKIQQRYGESYDDIQAVKEVYLATSLNLNNKDIDLNIYNNSSDFEPKQKAFGVNEKCFNNAQNKEQRELDDNEDQFEVH